VPDFVFHFSEDPAIQRFLPHVPPTNPTAGAHVWAIDAEHAPLYWFPRDCPRATVWARDNSELAALQARFATTARRVHWMESAWVERFADARLYEYRFAASAFREWRDAGGAWIAEGQWIADVEVVPDAVTPIGSCESRHSAAGIDLRVVDNLWGPIDAVVESGLPFSIVRARNARPRPS